MTIRLMKRIWILTLLFMITTGSQAETIHVRTGVPGGDGLSWETAFATVTEAIAAATAGDEIWVASGTYNESIQLVTGVLVYGGFLGTESIADFSNRDWMDNCTTIDASGLNTSVVVGENDAVLDGFTITGGFASAGAGILCLGTSPIIRHCLIIENKLCNLCTGPGLSAERVGGGGMYCEYSSPTIVDCTIIANSVELGIQPEILGVGLASVKSNVQIENCHISRNDGYIVPGPGISPLGNPQILGAGIGSSGGMVFLLECKITRNVASIDLSTFGPFNKRAVMGGGIYAGGSMMIRGCVLSDNSIFVSTANIPGMAAGGGLFCEGQVTIGNSILTGNKCSIDVRPGNTQAGGGIYCTGLLNLDHCTIAYNTVGLNNDGNGQGIFCATGTARLSNSIVWNGTKGVEGSNLIASYSDIEGGFPGIGNIASDPSFVDSPNGDYHLKLSSPCIDSGTRSGLANDLDGSPRPVDVIGRGVDGPDALDMGAFEFQLSPADLTQNGRVDSEDLLEFQQQWMREETEK